MSLKTFKPYTKTTRGTVLVSRNELWKGKPFKALTKKKDHQKVGIIMGELLLEILEVDINKDIEISIFIEKKLISKVQLKESNTIQIDHATSCLLNLTMVKDFII